MSVKQDSFTDKYGDVLKVGDSVTFESRTTGSSCPCKVIEFDYTLPLYPVRLKLKDGYTSFGRKIIRTSSKNIILNKFKVGDNVLWKEESLSWLEPLKKPGTITGINKSFKDFPIKVKLSDGRLIRTDNSHLEIARPLDMGDGCHFVPSKGKLNRVKNKTDKSDYKDAHGQLLKVGDIVRYTDEFKKKINKSTCPILAFEGAKKILSFKQNSVGVNICYVENSLVTGRGATLKYLEKVHEVKEQKEFGVEVVGFTSYYKKVDHAPEGCYQKLQIGDVIKYLYLRKVNTPQDICNILGSGKQNNTAYVEVLRKGKMHKFWTPLVISPSGKRKLGIKTKRSKTVKCNKEKDPKDWHNNIRISGTWDDIRAKGESIKTHEKQCKVSSSCTSDKGNEAPNDFDVRAKQEIDSLNAYLADLDARDRLQEARRIKDELRYSNLEGIKNAQERVNKILGRGDVQDVADTSGTLKNSIMAATGRVLIFVSVGLAAYALLGLL